MTLYPVEYLCELVGGPRDGEHMRFLYALQEIIVPLPVNINPLFKETELLHLTPPRVAVYRFTRWTGHLRFYTYAGERP